MLIVWLKKIKVGLGTESTVKSLRRKVIFLMLEKARAALGLSLLYLRNGTSLVITSTVD